MLDKKPIKGLQIRKPITVSRLIKCYVCNQHFQTQNLFDLHLQQHQNKFSKSSFQEMQGKTQESFRSKKSVPSLNRTQLIGPRSQTLSSLETLEKSQNAEKEQDLQEKEQREIAQALKESQILLEKIEFITQVNGKQQQETQPSQKDFDFEVIKKLIEGQRQLNFQINKAENKARIEELILETNFQQRYFENYQEQLLHLRLLASVAINPSSKAKINQIKDNICRDVCNQLQRHFAVQEVKTSSRRQKVEGAKLGENEGEIRNCVDCYGSIGGTDQYYSLSGGHCYHVECWKESAGE